MLRAALGTFAFVIFPEWQVPAAIVFYGGPILIFELLMGPWLLLHGITASPSPANRQ
jgi:hypothetical protein